MPPPSECEVKRFIAAARAANVAWETKKRLDHELHLSKEALEKALKEQEDARQPLRQYRMATDLIDEARKGCAIVTDSNGTLYSVDPVCPMPLVERLTCERHDQDPCFEKPEKKGQRIILCPQVALPEEAYVPFGKEEKWCGGWLHILWATLREDKPAILCEDGTYRGVDDTESWYSASGECDYTKFTGIVYTPVSLADLEKAVAEWEAIQRCL